jgi:two-component system LytT family response regulator
MTQQLIRTIIVDDDESNIINLRILLNTYCPDVEIVACATEVCQAINEIKTFNPDLVFLDVEIKNSTGFDLLEQLEKRDFNVIFVTAFDQYAIKALRFSAVDYLLKPIVIEDLENAVKNVQKRMSGNNQFLELENLMNNLRKEIRSSRRIALPMNGQIDFVPVSDIRRCIGESAYTTFYFKDGSKKVVSRTLKEYENLLAEYGFSRVHKSHLVNNSCIRSFVKTGAAYILLDDGDTVPVSDLKKVQLIKQLDG